MSATKQPAPTREAILADIAALTTMQRGTLAEEYRQRPDPTGKGTIRLGPYYKHQCWENGRNLSRRVSPQEAPHLREDLANHERFEQLSEQLVSLTVAETRALRTAAALSAGAHEAAPAKKNSRSSASPKGTAKVKPSSPRRAGASRSKA
jgi:hypothetical protein